VIKGIESWKSVITTPVAMDRSKTGSEDTGDFYVIGKKWIHVGSFEEST
jgi:hypothetical protein